MPDQNPKPKPEDIPSYEDVEKELGFDAMSFMSEPGDTEKE